MEEEEGKKSEKGSLAGQETELNLSPLPSRVVVGSWYI